MGDTLSKFGYSFQVKVVTLLITDREFLTQIVDLLRTDYLDSRPLKWIAEQTIFYFIDNKVLPTADVFKIQMANISDENLKTEVLSVLKECFKQIGTSDAPTIKETAIEFCKHQEIKRAFESSLDDFKRGDYEAIGRKLSDAIKRGHATLDFGHNYLNDVDFRYQENVEPEKIKTGFPLLDELMNGGLPRGNFGIVTAPSGAGKSWWLAKLGANALKEGKTVLHYTLELADIYTAKRYDSLLTGIPFDDLNYHSEQVKKTLDKFHGKLFIKNYPMRTLSLIALEAHIEKHIMAGVVPDLVILDYPELMKIDFTGVRDDKVLGDLYSDLRGLSQRLNFALWGADQTNRENSTKDIIGTDGISNSFAKIFALDFNMTFSRKAKDKVNSTGRLHISKNRLGTDGLTFPCKFDTYNAQIEIFSEKTETGKKVKEEMISDSDYELKYAQQQYDRFQKRTNNLF